MTIATEFERTKLDDKFDEIWAILKANGVTLEIAMAKLLELKAADSAAQEAEANAASRVTSHFFGDVFG